jgi:hypothetical protein
MFAALLMLAGCQDLQVAPQAQSTAIAERPRLSIGDRWTYRHTDGYTGLPAGVFTHTITAIEGGIVTVQIRNEAGAVIATNQFDHDWNWLVKPMTNLRRFRYAPPYRAFRFPLEPGARWSEQMSLTDVADEKVYAPAQVDGSVHDWRRVTVPAGAFDAIRVERAAYSGNVNFQRSQEYINEVDWYSPATNNIVAGSYRSRYRDINSRIDMGWRNGDWTQIELLEYRPAH